MKALIYDGQVRLVNDHPFPRRSPGECLVRVLRAGVCDTDLEISKGYMGFRGVLGHEFVGIVEESDRPELVGQRVVGEINCACGQCSYCLRGLRGHCPNRTVLGIWRRDGAFAEYLIIPVDNLHPLPEGVSDERGVFVEPLASAFRILEQVHIRPTDEVVVLGDGKLGLLVAQVVRLTGCHPLVVGRHPHKLAILGGWGIESRLADDLKGVEKVDVVIECTGSPAGLELALESVVPQGTIVLKTTGVESPRVHLSRLVIDEVTIVGSRCGPFPTAIRALEQGLMQVDPLIWKTYGLDQGVEAMEEASRREALKVILKMG